MCYGALTGIWYGLECLVLAGAVFGTRRRRGETQTKRVDERRSRGRMRGLLGILTRGIL